MCELACACWCACLCLCRCLCRRLCQNTWRNPMAACLQFSPKLRKPRQGFQNSLRCALATQRERGAPPFLACNCLAPARREENEVPPSPPKTGPHRDRTQRSWMEPAAAHARREENEVPPPSPKTGPRGGRERQRSWSPPQAPRAPQARAKGRGRGSGYVRDSRIFRFLRPPRFAPRAAADVPRFLAGT